MTKDYYSDQGHNFIKLFAKRELPEFVKEADAYDTEDLSRLPDSAFADPLSRRLPICRPEDVYVSAAYYYGANQKNASIEERIIKAASLFELTDEVNNLKSELTAEDKTASEEPTGWEFSFSKTAGEEVFEVSASGADLWDLDKVANEFEASFLQFGFEDRVKVAGLICDQYEQLNGTPSFSLLAIAGRNFPDTNKVASEIVARAIRIQDSTDKVALLKIAESFEESEDKSLAGMMKIAAFLDEVDQRADLRRFYGSAISNPHAAVFNTEESIARKLATVIDIAGDKYSYPEVLEFDREVLKLALEEDFDKVCDSNGIDPIKVAALSDDKKKVLASYL